MRSFKFAVLSAAFGSMMALGCTARVDETDDSIKIEAEVPKLELGEEKPDLDVRTDHDIDVDTPLPGDS